MSSTVPYLPEPFFSVPTAKACDEPPCCWIRKPIFFALSWYAVTSKFSGAGAVPLTPAIASAVPSPSLDLASQVEPSSVDSTSGRS